MFSSRFNIIKPRRLITKAYKEAPESPFPFAFGLLHGHFYCNSPFTPLLLHMDALWSIYLKHTYRSAPSSYLEFDRRVQRRMVQRRRVA